MKYFSNKVLNVTDAMTTSGYVCIERFYSVSISISNKALEQKAFYQSFHKSSVHLVVRSTYLTVY